MGRFEDSISTVQRYARKLDLKQGILNDKLIFIENFAGEFSEIDRECVLSFDEMKVCKNFEYDPTANEIVEPYSYFASSNGLGSLQKLEATKTLVHIIT